MLNHYLIQYNYSIQFTKENNEYIDIFDYFKFSTINVHSIKYIETMI